MELSHELNFESGKTVQTLQQRLEKAEVREGVPESSILCPTGIVQKTGDIRISHLQCSCFGDRPNGRMTGIS